MKQYVSRSGNVVSRQRDEQLRHPERQCARGAVYDAVLEGTLPPARSLSCSDCGNPAKEYDHYLGYAPEHRLDVQPVCRRCHYRREVRRRTTCRKGHVYAEVGDFLRNGHRVCRACASYGSRPKKLGEPGIHINVFITESIDAQLDELVRLGVGRNRSEVVRVAVASLHRTRSVAA